LVFGEEEMAIMGAIILVWGRVADPKLFVFFERHFRAEKKKS